MYAFKPYGRSLLLVAAALVAGSGGAAAADFAGDAQQRMGQVLAGRAAPRSAPAAARHDEWAARRNSDLQQLAQRILGATDSPVHGTAALPQTAAAAGRAPPLNGLRVHGDAQAIAQRLLLGQRTVRAAGS